MINTSSDTATSISMRVTPRHRLRAGAANPVGVTCL